MTAYRIEARHDDEAGVWYVADSNVPGLVTEADTLDELAAKLDMLIPELLECNDECAGRPEFDVPVEVVLHQQFRIRRISA